MFRLLFLHTYIESAFQQFCFQTDVFLIKLSELKYITNQYKGNVAVIVFTNERFASCRTFEPAYNQSNRFQLFVQHTILCATRAVSKLKYESLDGRETHSYLPKLQTIRLQTGPSSSRQDSRPCERSLFDNKTGGIALTEHFFQISRQGSVSGGQIGAGVWDE